MADDLSALGIQLQDESSLRTGVEAQVAVDADPRTLEEARKLQEATRAIQKLESEFDDVCDALGDADAAIAEAGNDATKKKKAIDAKLQLQRRKALVMLKFITKPWAQKTYALMSSSSMPVSQKAAAIVASKIPGGSEALNNYIRNDEQPTGKVRVKARIFRDQMSYDTISDALLDTIYDVRTPKESTEQILQDLKETR